MAEFGSPEHFAMIQRLVNKKDAELKALRAENKTMRAALETIAGQSSDRLQIAQAKAALANIGADVDG